MSFVARNTALHLFLPFFLYFLQLITFKKYIGSVLLDPRPAPSYCNGLGVPRPPLVDDLQFLGNKYYGISLIGDCRKVLFVVKLVGFGRATCSSAARTLLLRLINKQNEALRAP